MAKSREASPMNDALIQFRNSFLGDGILYLLGMFVECLVISYVFGLSLGSSSSVICAVVFIHQYVGYGKLKYA